MGCGATKLQSHVIQPDYHGNIKSSVETCDVKQNDIDNHSIVSDQVEEITDHRPQSRVEVASNHEQQVARCAEEQEYFQSQENSEKQIQDVNKQQVNKLQDIPKAGSISQLQGDEVTQQQTDELTVNQDSCDYEISKRYSDLQDNIEDVPVCAAAIVDIQADNEMSCYNDLLTNPQQCCSTARSLSQSPRIVSLQLELGFVSITSADLDMLQSKWYVAYLSVSPADIMVYIPDV